MSYGQIPYYEVASAGRRWGVVVNNLHIHCSKIIKNKENEVKLLDKDNKVICITREDKIDEVMLCNSNYQDVLTTVYSRDYE